MEKLDVLYTVNDKYLYICLGSILSLIDNGNVENLRVHIITSDFSIDDFRKVDRVLRSEQCEYYLYDLSKFDISKFNIPSWRGTQIANARLFFQEIMDRNLSEVDNLLYLDSDLMVVGDLSELSNYSSNAISAVRDATNKGYLQRLGGLSNYFNSGVLFFNTKEWTQGNYQDKLIHFMEAPCIDITFPDQDILNCALDGEIGELPAKYNLGATTYLFGSFGEKFYYNSSMNVGYKEIAEAKKDPKILHSTGVLGIKPWQKNRINPFNDVFMKYIYEVNPEFTKEELSLLKRALTANPQLFKLMILFKNRLPYNVQEVARNLTLQK